MKYEIFPLTIKQMDHNWGLLRVFPRISILVSCFFQRETGCYSTNIAEFSMTKFFESPNVFNLYPMRKMN